MIFIPTPGRAEAVPTLSPPQSKMATSQSSANCDDPGSGVHFAGGGVVRTRSDEVEGSASVNGRCSVTWPRAYGAKPDRSGLNPDRQHQFADSGVLSTSRGGNRPLVSDEGVSSNLTCQHQFAGVGWRPRGLARWSAAPAGGMGTQPESSTAPGVRSPQSGTPAFRKEQDGKPETQ